MNLLTPDEQGRLTIEDLEKVLKIIEVHPNDERIKQIVKQLDKDGDGLVALNEIIFLAGKENEEGTGIVIDRKSEKK